MTEIEPFLNKQKFENFYASPKSTIKAKKLNNFDKNLNRNAPLQHLDNVSSQFVYEMVQPNQIEPNHEQLYLQHSQQEQQPFYEYDINLDKNQSNQRQSRIDKQKQFFDNNNKQQQKCYLPYEKYTENFDSRKKDSNIQEFLQQQIKQQNQQQSQPNQEQTKSPINQINNQFNQTGIYYGLNPQYNSNYQNVFQRQSRMDQYNQENNDYFQQANNNVCRLNTPRWADKIDVDFVEKFYIPTRLPLCFKNQTVESNQYKQNGQLYAQRRRTESERPCRHRYF